MNKSKITTLIIEILRYYEINPNKYELTHLFFSEGDAEAIFTHKEDLKETPYPSRTIQLWNIIYNEIQILQYDKPLFY